MITLIVVVLSNLVLGFSFYFFYRARIITYKNEILALERLSTSKDTQYHELELTHMMKEESPIVVNTKEIVVMPEYDLLLLYFKESRENLVMSQKDVEDLTEISASTISRLENKKGYKGSYEDMKTLYQFYKNREKLSEDLE